MVTVLGGQTTDVAPGVPAVGDGPTSPGTGGSGPGRTRALHGVTGLLRWVVRTLLVVVPVFLFATFVTFVLGAVSDLSPAGVVLGDAATPEQVAEVEARFGLDKPVVVQYLDWLGGLLHGDLGQSWFNGISVSEQIGQRLEVSGSVAGLALIIGVVGGVTLGLLAALTRGSWIDRSITVVCTFIATIPPFVMAMALIVVFCVAIPLLPSAGYVSPTVDVGRWLACIILPALALSADVVADIARQLRTGLVSAYQENYVTGALVRGLSPRRILFKHVLRNGSGPAITTLGLRIPALIGGAVVTESIFAMPGYGRFAAEGALRGDVPVVQGALVVAIVLVLAFNLVINAMLVRLRPVAGRGI
ncbi:ABC transporter permease [Nakamurella leprariae]|uniref:ABC transporter permease n=1 Tax=Nakamurella leprariae TaxID=2803911 RepID=A0A939BX93_9ACTN|nr:ABC transporter permease [Nakamurella leprariae]MBM9468323.1 ABC transporter permease [Nakamurella leprariae]